MNCRGFTFPELLVTMAIVSVLATVAVPNLLEYRRASLSEDLASRFVDAVDWSRQAAMSQAKPVVLTLGSSCTWDVSVSGSSSARYSLTLDQRAQSYPDTQCSSSAGVLSFSPSGLLTGTATLTTPSAVFQVLASGTVLRTLEN